MAPGTSWVTLTVSHSSQGEGKNKQDVPPGLFYHSFQGSIQEMGSHPHAAADQEAGKVTDAGWTTCTEDKMPISPGGHRKDSKKCTAIKSVMAASHL